MPVNTMVKLSNHGVINMITIEQSAKDKINDLYIDENDLTIRGLRIFVQGGGCSGFQYGFTLDEEQNEDDFVIEAGTFKVLVDAMSMQYLQDAVIDYKEEPMGSNFTVTNPNAQSSCGCGSSFSV